MTWNRVALALLTAVALTVTPGLAQAADYHHVHITTSSPAKGVEWYSDHMGCEPLADRDDAASCDGVEIVEHAVALPPPALLVAPVRIR